MSSQETKQSVSSVVSSYISWQDLAKHLVKGDLVQFRRSNLETSDDAVETHWGVYIGFLKGVPHVIRYCTEDIQESNGSAELEVQNDTLEHATVGFDCRKNNAWDPSDAPSKPEEILEIAKIMVGERCSEFYSNSEEFVRLCRYRKDRFGKSYTPKGAGESLVLRRYVQASTDRERFIQKSSSMLQKYPFNQQQRSSMRNSLMSDSAREKLRAAVGCAILELTEPSLDSVRQHIYPDVALDAAAEAALRAAYTSQMRVVILSHCKEAMTISMERDAAVAASLFVDAPNGDRFAFLNGAPEALRLLRALSIDSEVDAIYHELAAFQRRLTRGMTGGLSFPEALIEFLRSGEPTKELWRALKEWMTDGGGLAFFRKRVEPLFHPDSKGSVKKVLEAATNLNAQDEFVDPQQILQILEHYCSSTIDDGDQDGHLVVKGATIAASLVTEDIRKRLSSSAPPHTISIYAADCCSMDVSFITPEWHGINLCIVTRRLYVHEKISIDLSGRSFEPTPSAEGPHRPGSAGKSGRAGASSGNLCILAAELVGADRLTVRLNGGRGEDGQCGATGEQGTAGVGITEREIRAMQYPGDERSPDEASCKMFQHFENLLCPRAKLYEFVDTKGRRVMYSSGGSEVLVFVQGTIGEDGGCGGAGGAGGEGGYAGTCHITDFEGSKPLSLSAVECKRGENGTDGAHGSRGPPGEDGNDMHFSGGRLIRSSARGKKLRVEYSTVFFTPSNAILVPHTYSRLWTQTFASFEEYTPTRDPTTDPKMHHPDRVLAIAQATLQASTAMSEFAKMSGSELSLRVKAAREVAAGVGRGRVRTSEGMHMVRERSPGVEERYGEEELEPETNLPRPCLLLLHSTDLCIREKLRNVELWRKSTIRHIMKSGSSFEIQFAEAQSAVRRQNADLVQHLEEFIERQPPVVTCEEFISDAFEKQTSFAARVDFAKNAIKARDGSSFIRLLYVLLSADGEKPCAVKWRTIIDTIRTIADHLDQTVLSLVLACTPIDELMDAIIHLLLIVATRKLDLLLSSKLWPALQALKSTEARALLMVKLDEVGEVDTDELLEVLVLLRHADRQLQQLSLLSYREWTNIARKQNWMLVDQENFGSTAYYLGVLARGGFLPEQKGMRDVLSEWKYSEQLFGRFVHCIVSRELVADEDFCTRLLSAIRDGELKDVIGLLPDRLRSLQDVAQLVRGSIDLDDDARIARQEQMRLIVNAIAQPAATKHSQLLAAFDAALERTTGKRLRAVQKVVIMSALESPQHLLQQVSTGEGKSFIIAAIAAIRCLLDKSATVDVISSSSVLAERDATHLKSLFEELGLSVAHNCHEAREKREIAYKARIVYGDMAHFQRDYLLHTFYRKNIRGARQLDRAIVDEVDSMTLDSGNHVLYLSHKLPSMKLLDSLFAFIQQEVHSTIHGEQDTETIRKQVLRDIYGRFSKEDIAKMDPSHAERIFGTLKEGGWIDEEGFILERMTEKFTVLSTKLILITRHAPMIVDAVLLEMERERQISLPFHLRDFVRLHISTFIDNCRRARVMRPNVDYVLDVDQSSSEVTVTIVDGDTGADMTSTQWAGGLHQFLQMKHACRISPMSLKAVFISNVTFLRKYQRLDGLSGTLGSLEESRTLAALYSVDLIRVPTHQPRRMVEYVPALCTTHQEWVDAVYERVSEEMQKSRSVLVICETIEQLQQLQSGLSAARAASPEMKAAMDSAIIYTRQHETLEYEERGLEAGRVIFSTNLAGRGTDILLSKELESAGGLHVIIAFVPRNKRIEEQAMGRAARCGARGSGQIIAHVRPAPGDIAPSYLDFQARRDNAEVVRIQALRHHFEFRIAVEEGALERFRHAIDHKLFREASSNQRMPEAEDVIYRALLDEWTLWLDAKDEEIKRCADTRDALEKETIIRSVDTFLLTRLVEKRPNPAAGQDSIIQKINEMYSSLVRDHPELDINSIIVKVESGISVIRASNMVTPDSMLGSFIGKLESSLALLRSDNVSNYRSTLVPLLSAFDEIPDVSVVKGAKELYSSLLGDNAELDMKSIIETVESGIATLRANNIVTNDSNLETIVDHFETGLALIQSDKVSDFRSKLEPIVRQVDAYISSRVFDKQPAELFVVPEWIRAGEWLLRLGIIQACHRRGRTEAERTFTRVAEEGDSLAPYAHFYLACLAMTRFEDMRQRQTSLHLEDQSAFKKDVDRAIMLFARARVGFIGQLERRNTEVQGIQRRAQSGGGTDCGLQLQHRELAAAVQKIVGNIDWLIGEPMSAAAFHPLISDPKRKTHLFESLKSIDVFSFPELAKDLRLSTSHCHRIIRRKFGLGKTELLSALSDSVEDTSNVKISGGGAALERRCVLPNRMDFWKDMHAIGAFREIEHVYIINEDRMETVTFAIGIPPVVINEDRARTGILFSNRGLRNVSFYQKSELDDMISSCDQLAMTVRTLLDEGGLELDMLARIDVSRLHGSHLLQFDGFTPLQLKQHFEFDEATCNWLLNQLSSRGVIEMRRVATTRLDSEWKKKSQNFKWTSANCNVTIDEEGLECLERLQFAFTISPEVLERVLDSEPISVEDSSRLFQDLIETGLLKQSMQVVYRQTGRLDCSFLPSTLAEPMIRFLSYHFSYTFARDAMASACTDADRDAFTVKEVLLPEDAHRELYDELCQMEVVSPSRIVSDHYDLIDYDDFPFLEKRELELFIHSHRQKLRDDIQMFSLVPFVDVLTETGALHTSEMESLIDVGMAAGVSLKKLSTTKKVAGALFGCGRFLAINGLRLLNGIAFVLGMVLGEASHIAGTVVGDIAGRAVPEKYSRAMYSGASASVDAIGWMQNKLIQLSKWAVGAATSHLMSAAISIAEGCDGDFTRAVGRGIHESMGWMYEKCTALFGSAEYYDQCRIATHSMAARALPSESMDEYRLIRLFNNVGAATEEQNRKVHEREQSTIDMITAVSRKLRAELISHFLLPPSVSFPGLSEFITSLENQRWFESELELALQLLAMEARRELIDTGRLEHLEMSGVKHLIVAYAALLKDVRDECEQRSTEEEETSEEDNMEAVLMDMIDLKMSDLFTQPLVNFTRCIISEHLTSEFSQPHQEILDADIATAARQLCKGRSNAWLEALQDHNLVITVHAKIAELHKAMEQVTLGGERMVRHIVDLMHFCLLHRLPMPYEPCLSILCLVSEHIEMGLAKTLEQDTASSLNRYVILSKADKFHWRVSVESVYLFEMINGSANGFENAETLRDALITSLRNL